MNEQFYHDQELIRQDESQWEAYESNVNTAVVAGPGSGKTRVLTLKAIKLIETQINKPSGLACISYSRETVRELKKRLRQYGYKNRQEDFIGTIHGFCLMNIIQPFAHLFPRFNVSFPIKIASDEVCRGIYNGVLNELEIESDQLSLLNLNKQRSLSINGSSGVEIQTNAFEVQAAELYEQKLSDCDSVDFISMVNIATHMIRESDYIKTTLESRFPWLLIDEYQDLGKSLHEMVLELKNHTSIKIFAVGDMNQSIYGFSGAYPDFLEELNNLEDIKSIPLTSNYRSNQGIIEGSLDALNITPPRPEYVSRVEGGNQNAKFLFLTCQREMNEQYKVVAEKVIPKLLERGVRYDQIGILTGASREVIEMATTLRDNSIPFFIVKWQFQNSDFVVWLQDCAQWVLGINNQSFDSIFQFWKHQLIAHEDYRSFLSVSKQKIDFYEIMESSKNQDTVFEWLSFILEKLEIETLLSDSDRHPDELDNLSKLKNEAENGNLRNLELKRFAFLGIPENEITITTRHSAKGLEFEVVILLGMEEGRFPYTYNVEENSRAMLEAYRLCYVSVSRAKSECILVRSCEHTIITRTGRPWTIPYEPSRFWNTLLARFQTNENVLNASDY
ncbi:MAG: ATP-dependent helicase [Flavobacteriales bacterium]|nr:ATP-dependent helicase [Flavobacteriales bacterium]